MPAEHKIAVLKVCTAFSFSFRPSWLEIIIPAPDATAIDSAINISIKGTETAAAAIASRPKRLPIKPHLQLNR